MGYSAYYPTLASQRDGGGGVWFISDLYFSSNILLAEFHSTLNSFSVLGQERILMTSFKGHIHRKLARQGEGKWGRACLGHNSSRALQGLRVSDRQTETQGALKDWAHTARSVRDIFT